MKRHVPGIITALLVGVLLLSGWKVARASAVLAGAPQAGERTGLVVRRNAPLRARTATPMAEIARAERALVFVYSPDCSVCHANMANWIDLVGQLKGGSVGLYAVAPMDTPPTRAYWGSMTRYVRVVTATPAEVQTAFGVDVTPVTLLVERGRVRGAVTGSLTSAARGQLRAFVRGEEW